MDNLDLKRLRMPRLLKARLDHFSLYSAKKTIEVQFNMGALCLAGANGIGKSAFLAAINYGLTGIVADPSRGFDSVVEYYDYSLGFADEFFDGRVDEGDRERAQVSLDFSIGTKIFHLTRGVFERERLRAFSVDTPDPNDKVDTRRSTPSDRHAQFAQSLRTEIGLDSFQQFVF